MHLVPKHIILYIIYLLYKKKIWDKSRTDGRRWRRKKGALQCIPFSTTFFCFWGYQQAEKRLERKTHHHHLVLFNYFFSDRGNVVENASRARSHANVSTCPTHVLREHIMSLTAPFYYHRELYNSCSSNNSPLNFSSS